MGVLYDQAVKIRAAMDKGIAAVSGTADTAISCMAMAREWMPGNYAVGDVRRYNGNLYRCAQAHDSGPNPAWTPEAAPALWAAYHGTTAETALPWAQPTGAHDMYKSGEYMIWTDGKIYRCKMDTVYTPVEYAQAWEVQNG